MLLTIFQNFTITDWIGSLSAIASLITAIIALLTVREIKKQREHSYYPDLNLANFEFFVYKYDKEEQNEEEKDDTIFLYYAKKQIEESQPKTGYNELSININNIGFGVAKAINYEWSFDFREAQKVIDANAFELNEDDFCITFSSLNVDWTYALNEENYGDFINFILPYSQENRNIEIRIPQYFMDLYWVYMAKGLLTKDVSIGDRFPPIVLSINYENIHGKVINKVFSIFLRFIFIANPQTEKSELAKFKFEISEIH